MKKSLFIIFFILLLLSSAQANKKTNPWQNICEFQKNLYCSNVGKMAYDGRNDIKLGKIIGVTFKLKGSLISASNFSRVSPRDAFYYIIDDGMSNAKPFIRQCREIEAKRK